MQTEMQELMPAERQDVMELMNSWQEEGMVKGIKLGLRRAVERQLTSRFGSIPPGLLAQIDSLPEAALEELTEALLTFTDLHAAETWLKAKADSEPISS
jgi:hypothetical protein